MILAVDWVYSKLVMFEIFLMSNIFFQACQFNGGIWWEFEELIWEWAKDVGELYVVMGFLLDMELKGVIGNNEVIIFGGYFKVLFDFEELQFKVIGFVFLNIIFYELLYKFVVMVDEVEVMIGLDFFVGFLLEEVEIELEVKVDIDLWLLDKDKFRK